MDKQTSFESHDKHNCSTVIVGKNASKTGKVIVGHNEDDNDVVVIQYKVPRKKHEPGEMIRFEEGKALIPQVEETYEYYWSEMRASTWAVSFADTFVNEWGVALVSNNCRPCKESVIDPQDGEIGYGIRRLVAERSKTAREGVEVAIALVEKYGYFACRSYHICDKNEAWVLQLTKGRYYVAKRLPDDEVYYIPNWYTIHEVDFSDTEHKNYYFPKDLAEFAIKNGWYKPANPNSYSDFDFRDAYKDGADEDYNIYRARNAWGLLLGKEPEDSKMFSAKLDRKIGVEDIKKVLRFHFEGTKDDITDGYNVNPHVGDYHFTCCNYLTAESCVIELNDDPALTCIWRATLRPCTSPYQPWYYGMSKIPDGYSWYAPEVAQVSHFFTPESDNEYNPKYAFWAFKTLQYFTDFDYKGVHKTIQDSIKLMEEKWYSEKATVEKTYKDLKAVSDCAATRYLTEYTGAAAKYAWDWAKNMIMQLGEEKYLENSAEK